MKPKSWSLIVGLVVASALFVDTARAQVYPSKPIRWIVPYPAGGTGDFVVRTVAGPMMKSLGQNVIADFRPGGSTVIGTELAVARARPGELTYGTAGLGGAHHISVELLGQLAKASILHVPHQGVAPAMVSVVGGHVSMLVLNVPDVVPYAAAGRLRPIAVTSASRSPALKDVPTVAESGFPGYDFQLWIGAVMVRATPREAVGRLSTEIVRALEQSEVKAALDKLGFVPAPLNPGQFDAFIRAEIQQNEKVARRANIRIE